ncbi:TauD/TfdA family dioxygenase [Spongorhabdus nitratireducens]
MEVQHQPVPEVWLQKTGSLDSFITELTPKQQALLKQAACDTDSTGMSAFQDLCVDILSWQSEVLFGNGLLILRGFPVDELTSQQRDALYRKLGKQLGELVPQDLEGELFGRVEDVEGEVPHARGYLSRKALSLHTDRGDIVSLLGVRSAATGGVTSFISSYAIYDELLKQAPHVLPVLCDGFHYASPYQKSGATDFRIPVFSWHEDVLSCYCTRAFIEFAAEARNIALTAKEIEALDWFEAISGREDMVHSIRLQPGDWAIWNNHTIIHKRTAFEAVSEASQQKGRLLLRLWLSVGDRWPLCPVLKHYVQSGITSECMHFNP